MYISTDHTNDKCTGYELHSIWEWTNNKVHFTFTVCPGTYTIMDTSDLVKRYVNEPHDAMKLVPLGVF